MRNLHQHSRGKGVLWARPSDSASCALLTHPHRSHSRAMLRRKLLIAYLRLKDEIENDPPSECATALHRYRDRVMSVLMSRWYY